MISHIIYMLRHIIYGTMLRLSYLNLSSDETLYQSLSIIGFVISTYYFSKVIHMWIIDWDEGLVV